MRAPLHCLSLLVALASLTSAASAVNIEWVTVGDPGNPCDTQAEGCFGAVAYTYQISKYETTNAQYAGFLNAVAATDTNALYNPMMAVVGGIPITGGIARSGSDGSYTYSVIPGRENMPVLWLSFYDALRFANWLHNGQPSGAQDLTTTEDGAYTITAAGIAANSITRNAGASIVLTNEDEWYKAAYYDVGSSSYFDYPAGFDSQTACAPPSATPNTANCLSAVGTPTEVGSYTGSASPSGTFDQGGNAWEWIEASSGLNRLLRGGRWNTPATDMEASAFRDFTGPQGDLSSVGFRVAQIPEPNTGLLVMTGLLGLAGYRRPH